MNWEIQTNKPKKHCFPLCSDACPYCGYLLSGEKDYEVKLNVPEILRVLKFFYLRDPCSYVAFVIAVDVWCLVSANLLRKWETKALVKVYDTFPIGENSSFTKT